MKFGCMSCGASYDVPDERVRRAGPTGLLIRCTRCSAVMAVAESSSPGGSSSKASVQEPADAPSIPLDAPAARGLSPAAAPASWQAGREASTGSAPLTMGARGEVDREPVAPAALSASGVFRPLPGVHRQVTGFFFPDLEELKGDARRIESSRLWYAAIDNRPRGPFAASEMIDLAERGKIRDATLVWRPGFPSWRKVRHGGAFGTAEDLSWLRKPVLARKLREMEAQERAQGRGIPAVHLTRTSLGGNKPSWSARVEGLPPPLPPEDDPPAARPAAVPAPAPVSVSVSVSVSAQRGVQEARPPSPRAVADAAGADPAREGHEPTVDVPALDRALPVADRAGASEDPVAKDRQRQARRTSVVAVACALAALACAALLAAETGQGAGRGGPAGAASTPASPEP